MKQNNLRKAFLTVEVLISMVIIFMAITILTTSIKTTSLLERKKEHYELEYITIKSIINLVEKTDFSIQSQSKDFQPISLPLNELNGYTFTVMAKKIQEDNNRIEGIHGVSKGTTLISLYQILLKVKKDTKENKYSFYHTKVKKDENKNSIYPR